MSEPAAIPYSCHQADRADSLKDYDSRSLGIRRSLLARSQLLVSACGSLAPSLIGCCEAGSRREPRQISGTDRLAMHCRLFWFRDQPAHDTFPSVHHELGVRFVGDLRAGTTQTTSRRGRRGSATTSIVFLPPWRFSATKDENDCDRFPVEGLWRRAMSPVRTGSDDGFQEPHAV